MSLESNYDRKIPTPHHHFCLGYIGVESQTKVIEGLSLEKRFKFNLRQRIRGPNLASGKVIEDLWER